MFIFYKIRYVLAGLLLLFSASGYATQAEPILDKITLAGPAAGVSNALIHMVNTNALHGIAKEVEFIQWKNPDQLRALMLQGDVDFMALPTNVGANLYNKGVDLTLLNVSQWGVLWMISRDPNKTTLADFKGEEIAIPFRADMPDIVFTRLAKEQGINLKKDFKLNYTASPIDAMQMLVMRKVDHALLAEPALSMALRKTKSFPLSIVAPELFRSVDLQKEWGRLMNTQARIPQAGIAVLNTAKHSDALITRFEQAYAAANTWCQQNPDPCGEEVAAAVPMLNADAVADSIKVQSVYYADAYSAKPELKAFFQVLLDGQAASIGGKLPDDNFYWNHSNSQ